MENSKVEPYVGMPVYLDDSFFDFVSASAAPTEEDFISVAKQMKRPNTDRNSNCENNWGSSGGNMDGCTNGNSGGCTGGSGSGSGNAGSNTNNNSNCTQGCDSNGNLTDCVMNCPLAMAYVPMQRWGETYDMEKGFKAGTIFPCLDLPFKGGNR